MIISDFSFSFLGKTINSYGLMVMIGVLFGVLLIILLSRKYAVDSFNAVAFFALSGVGAAIGAKILYIIVTFSQIMEDAKLLSSYQLIVKYLTNGFVFYGGLIGAWIGLLICCRLFKENTDGMIAAVMPGFIVFAGMGRIGCSLVGCCHGIETESSWFYFMYTNSQLAPNNLPLIPVQAMEALLDFIIAAVLVCVINRSRFRDYGMYFYLTVYSVFRFIIEFFRGDELRGSLGAFSSSQWISIALLIFTLILLIVKIRREKGKGHESLLR